MSNDSHRYILPCVHPHIDTHTEYNKYMVRTKWCSINLGSYYSDFHTVQILKLGIVAPAHKPGTQEDETEAPSLGS